MAKGSISIRAGSGSYALSWQSGYGGMSSGYGGYAISKPTASSYANAVMKMKGYSIKQRLYGPVSLFPVPYSRIEETLRNEMFRKYKKKCPSCGKEPIGSGCYSLN